MAKLIAIVAVDEGSRVRCQQPNCGHTVYRRIHVVEDNGALLVLGSTCFAKRYGNHQALGGSTYGGGDGKVLSEEERKLLVANTAALIEKFEAERLALLAQHNARLAELRARLDARALQTKTPPIAITRQPQGPAMPWPWVKPMSSLAYFRLRDGTAWIRAQHTNASQMLMPWPSFDGWDECLPASIGTPVEALGGVLVKDIAQAIAYLRGRSTFEKVGSWRDIVRYIT
jgi:hypothetical protein